MTSPTLPRARVEDGRYWSEIFDNWCPPAYDTGKDEQRLVVIHVPPERYDGAACLELHTFAETRYVHRGRERRTKENRGKYPLMWLDGLPADHPAGECAACTDAYLTATGGA